MQVIGLWDLQVVFKLSYCIHLFEKYPQQETQFEKPQKLVIVVLKSHSIKRLHPQKIALSLKTILQDLIPHQNKQEDFRMLGLIKQSTFKKKEILKRNRCRLCILKIILCLMVYDSNLTPWHWNSKLEKEMYYQRIILLCITFFLFFSKDQKQKNPNFKPKKKDCKKNSKRTKEKHKKCSSERIVLIK